MISALFIAAASPLALPSTLNPAFVAAASEMFRYESCFDGGREPKYQRRERRYDELVRKAEEIWGHGIARYIADFPAEPRFYCDRRTRDSVLKRLATNLDTSERILEQAILPLQRGVWIGALQLCRDSVAAANLGKDFLGESVLRVTLSPEAGKAFATLTGAFAPFDSGLSRIALRIRGAIVAQIRLNEQIGSDELTLYDGDPPKFTSLATALLERC